MYGFIRLWKALATITPESIQSKCAHGARRVKTALKCGFTANHPITDISAIGIGLADSVQPIEIHRWAGGNRFLPYFWVDVRPPSQMAMQKVTVFPWHFAKRNQVLRGALANAPPRHSTGTTLLFPSVYARLLANVGSGVFLFGQTTFLWCQSWGQSYRCSGDVKVDGWSCRLVDDCADSFRFCHFLPCPNPVGARCAEQGSQ